MRDVPKSVVNRLRETPAVAEPHPDADVLTAFVEQSLADRERDQVMEHLARCGDCRDVVAFALPASEAATLPGSVSVTGSRWLTWPVLRWGVVAAGIVLVVSFGVLQYQQHGKKVEMVSTALRYETPAAVQNLSSPPQPAPQVPPASTEMAKKKSLPSAEGVLASGQSSPTANRIFPRPLFRGGTAGGIAGGVIGGTGIGSGQAAKQNAPATAVPPSSEVVEVQGETAQVTTAERSRTQDQVGENEVAENQIGENPEARPAQPRARADFDVVGKAKDPVPAPVGSSSASGPAITPPAIALQTSPALMLHASPRWSINSAGVLQRSFDAGKTWEDVDVTSAPAPPLQPHSFGGNITAGDEHKKIQREKTASSSSPVFRAVAAIGSEVWAGGSASVLYHSADSGAHWTQVLPVAAGAVLTGDVTVIEFSDPQHGSVTTSARELWVTADGGRSWVKQQ